MYGKISTFVILVFVFFALSCSGRSEQSAPFIEEVWSIEFTSVGVYSSPRVADLNGDGVKDVIIGTGKNEFIRADTAVVAISGATGEMLWSVPARDQVYGSATFLDINRDGIPDVLIGGRAAVLMAIDGKTGEIIWEFFPDSEDDDPRNYGFYNFNNPQLIPDQTGNGLNDILVSNGGDDRAPPFSLNRPPGRLMVIDSSDGRLLAQVEMPDSKETYMSPVITKIHENDEDLTIIFGTGGETIGGHLYRTTLTDVLNEDISDATVLASSKGKKGFIAPPVLIDITENSYYDIVVSTVEGRMLAIDGKENTLLWETSIEEVELEGYASFGVGYFNNKHTPGFFTTLIVGISPFIRTNSTHLMMNGASGEIEFQSLTGYAHMVSPVIADFNGNGYDDALMSINFKGEHLSSELQDQYNDWHNMLVVFDFKNNNIFQLTPYQRGINLTSTPWIGDLDGNGKLDIIYCFLTHDHQYAHMRGFRMIRLASDIEAKPDIKWGAYMGSDYDSVFR